MNQPIDYHKQAIKIFDTLLADSPILTNVKAPSYMIAEEAVKSWERLYGPRFDAETTNMVVKELTLGINTIRYNIW